MAAVILAKRRHRQKVATGGTFILLFVIINKSRVFMEKKVFLIVRLPCSAVGSSVSYPSTGFPLSGNCIYFFFYEWVVCEDESAPATSPLICHKCAQRCHLRNDSAPRLWRLELFNGLWSSNQRFQWNLPRVGSTGPDSLRDPCLQCASRERFLSAEPH